MTNKHRWVLLKHENALGDLKKIHFDLLLEDGNACRTWRLEEIPVIDGNKVSAIRSPMHRLEWLEKISSAVSNGRGWATRVEAGFFEGSLPSVVDDPISVTINSQNLSGQLEIRNGFCRVCQEKFKFDTST